MSKSPTVSDAVLRQGRRRPNVPALLALFACCWLGAGLARAGDEVESKVKAGYLFNIAKFTEWPESKFAANDSPLVIGCFCDAGFAGILERTVAGKTAGTRRIAVRRVAGAEDMRGCHILFVGSAQTGSAGPLLARAKDLNVLSVGETDGFLGRGGMVNFYNEQDTVHFEINPKTAERAGLKLSSRLLTVARISQ